MADSSGSLPDTIDTADAQKEVIANEFMYAASVAILFGNRASTTAATTWGYYGGDLELDGVITQVASGTVALTVSSTNYVEATRAGVVSANTTGYTPGRIPLYRVVVGASSITSWNDDRAPWRPSYLTHDATFAVTASDVTLTAAQARCRRLATSGTLTGNRNVIVPDRGEWIVYNGCSGAFTLTVKTTAGGGIVVAQSTHAIVYADGTNVVRITADNP
jgi:hypothetical protein